eukprot:scaffold7621_cov152-Skeletonema_menzelii.AAC.4
MLRLMITQCNDDSRDFFKRSGVSSSGVLDLLLIGGPSGKGPCPYEDTVIEKIKYVHEMKVD